MRHITDRDAEVYQTITNCLDECKSIEHFKMLLDLRDISYSKTSELDFVVWMYGQVSSHGPKLLATKDIKSKLRYNGKLWWARDLLYHLHKARQKVIYRKSKTSQNQLVNRPLRMLQLWCRANIDRIVSGELAMRWLVTKLTMKQGKNNIFNGIKDTLLYYWMKKHHLDMAKIMLIAGK